MRAVVQTVGRASVTIAEPGGDPVVVAAIGTGLLVLLGVTHTDTAAAAAAMARKVFELRVFDSDDTEVAQDGSAESLDLPILVVSQFTLYADTRKGRRPSWSAAAPAELAAPIVDSFVQALQRHGAKVQTGRFRARMLVESVNVGPRTIILDSATAPAGAG